MYSLKKQPVAGMAIGSVVVLVSIGMTLIIYDLTHHGANSSEPASTQANQASLPVEIEGTLRIVWLDDFENSNFRRELYIDSKGEKISLMIEGSISIPPSGTAVLIEGRWIGEKFLVEKLQTRREAVPQSQLPSAQLS